MATLARLRCFFPLLHCPEACGMSEGWCRDLNSPTSPSLMAALIEEVEKAAVYLGAARDSCLRGVTDRMRKVILMTVVGMNARM